MTIDTHAPSGRTRFAITALAFSATALLAACNDDGPAPPAPPPPVALSCAQLASLTIPASAIGLPTTGATVTSSATVAASGSGPHRHRRVLQGHRRHRAARCRRAEDQDADRPADDMERQGDDAGRGRLRLDDSRGHRQRAGRPRRPARAARPRLRGVASDSGHQAGALGSQDGSFGVNDEAVVNFSYAALKKTRDVAVALIKARYAVAGPTRSYFAGGSSGGREALAVVQKWPQDWDGAIVLYPAGAAASPRPRVRAHHARVRATGRLSEPGQAQAPLRRGAAGLRRTRRRDRRARQQHPRVQRELRSVDRDRGRHCAALPGRHRGRRHLPVGRADHCIERLQHRDHVQLSAGQRRDAVPGLQHVGDRPRHPRREPAAADGHLPRVRYVAAANPMPATAPYGSTFWDQWVKYFVTRDPNFNSLTLDPQNPGAYQARISALTGIQDVNQTDLTPFLDRGGRILMAHGMSDALVSTRATEQYYDRVVATMGASRVTSFVRFYEIPGYGHAVSTVFNAAWDSLTTLENWVERGVAPPAQVVADTVGVPGRTRPLCEYPAFPRYNGSGDVNAAASFTCATS